MIIKIKIKDIIVAPQIKKLNDATTITKSFFSLSKNIVNKHNLIIDYKINTNQPNVLQSLNITKTINSQSALDLTFSNLSDETIRSLTNSTYRATIFAQDENNKNEQLLFIGDLVNAASSGDVDKTIRLHFLSAHYALSMPCYYENLKPAEILRKIAQFANIDSHLGINKNKINEIFSEKTNQDFATNLDILHRICQQYDFNWYIDNDILEIFEKRTATNKIMPQAFYYDEFKLNNFYSYDNSINCSFSIPNVYTNLKVGNSFIINSIRNPVYSKINKITKVDIPFRINRMIYSYNNKSGIIKTEISAQDANTI